MLGPLVVLLDYCVHGGIGCLNLCMIVRSEEGLVCAIIELVSHLLIDVIIIIFHDCVKL